MELAVGDVEAAGLQLDVQRGVRLQADQVVHDGRGVAVVCAVVELGNRPVRVLKVLVPGGGRRGRIG